MSDAAEARVRAALAAGAAPTPDDVAAVLGLLDRARAESAQRWEAIGRLAPAAKAQRGRAQDAGRLLDELKAALAAPLDDAARHAWRSRIDRSGRGG
ncbi:MAG: hypothetical protein IPH44_00270 [Myxococcales bacterium]|nr:hypothetical protein [Myxococcales bacterium]MBK7197741.1 hypothetical protein [Myxococcales bacterium]MBP6845814.1 hypothetical protein [Kofleriaceae bacterium]